MFLRVTDSDSETGTLFVVNTDGSGLRRIMAPGFAEDSGSWSPDGKWILFSNNKQKLFVVDPDGTGLHQINLDISGGYPPASPHGRPTAPRSCSACSWPAPAGSASTPCGQPAQTCAHWPTPKAAKNSPTGEPTRWPTQRPRRHAHQQQAIRQHFGRRGASGVTSERRGPAHSSPGQGPGPSADGWRAVFTSGGGANIVPLVCRPCSARRLPVSPSKPDGGCR